MQWRDMDLGEMIDSGEWVDARGPNVTILGTLTGHDDHTVEIEISEHAPRIRLNKLDSFCLCRTFNGKWVAK